MLTKIEAIDELFFCLEESIKGNDNPIWELVSELINQLPDTTERD